MNTNEFFKRKKEKGTINDTKFDEHLYNLFKLVTLWSYSKKLYIALEEIDDNILAVLS